MITTIQYNSRKLQIDLSKPLDISISVSASDTNVNAWYLGKPQITPETIGDSIMSVSEGAAVNFNTITFNPHAHGTHTETVGHILEQQYPIHNCLNRFFFLAEVITVAPERENGDDVISAKQLQFAIGNKKREAVIIRTIPNTEDKKTRQYSHTNWPYFTEEAMALLVKKGIKHVLVDLPSVDKEKDEGQLLAHRAFWDTSNQLRTDATITEFIYVSNNIEDGCYMLDLQIASFENDASPSKPILYKVIT